MIEIRDLELNRELDKKAMDSLSGGCYPGYAPAVIPFRLYYPCLPVYFYPCFQVFPYPGCPYPFYGYGAGAFGGQSGSYAE